MKGCIDLLMEKLYAFAASGSPTDMVKWYNLTTFDIIGPLAFGEPFDGLKKIQLPYLGQEHFSSSSNASHSCDSCRRCLC